jgi:polysaccharide biosynthesis protein PslG
MVWNRTAKRSESGNSGSKPRYYAVASVVAAGALLLTACGGGSEITGSETPVPTESAVIDPNAVQPSLVGLHIEGAEGGAWASAPFGALRLWDNGTAWSQIELAKGEFKWDNLDGIVETSESRGLTDILYVMGTTPDWAAANPKKLNAGDYPQSGAAEAPANIADWSEWVTAVVTRYKGRISSYQIWNEANLANFFNGTPAQMAELTKVAYDIIKAIDPEAQVVSASPSTRLVKSFDRFFPKYLEELAVLDWPVDVIAIHTYPDATGDPSVRATLILKAIDLLKASGAPALPLWDTELNYGLAGPGDIPKQEITGARAAGFVVRTYIDDLRLGVDRSYWYIWTLQPYDLLGVQAYSGSDGEQGFFAVNDWVTGATFGGCTEADNAVVCDFSRDGTSWIVAWAQAGEVVYTTPDNSQLVCDPLAVCKEAPPASAVTLTEVPVRIYLQ